MVQGSGSEKGYISISEIDEDTRYTSLVTNYAVQTDAKIGYGDRGRGLFSTRLIPKGEVALSVPVNICLFHRLKAEDAGVSLESSDGALSEEDKKKLAWASEMWLTVELMKLLEEAAGKGQGFWAEYWWLLPPPSCKLPINLPRSALETLQEIDSPLAQALTSHRRKLREAWGARSGHDSCLPAALFWANSMVLSRCFHFWGAGGSSILGGMCPFIDLLNHDADPTCRLVMEDGGAAVQAIAVRDIPAGEELTHPYAAGASNLALLWRFGFAVGGNPMERLTTAGPACVFPAQLLRRCFGDRRPDGVGGASGGAAAGGITERVWASLCDGDGGGGGGGGGGPDTAGSAARCGGGEGGAAYDDEEERDKALVLAWEVRRQLAAAARGEALAAGGELLCDGLAEYLAERRRFLREVAAACRALALALGAGDDELPPGGDDGAGAGDLLGDLAGRGGESLLPTAGDSADDFLAGFLGAPAGAGGGGGGAPAPDIYAMLAPRTEEELAAYNSDDDSDDGFAVAVEGFAAAVVVSKS